MKLWNFLKKNKEEKKDAEIISKLEPAWFPIWEDTELLEKIRHSIYKTNPKSFQTKVNINLKLVEYSYSVEEETLEKIPLVSVGEIMSKFETVSPEEFSQLSPGEEFIPKIAKVENTVAIIGDIVSGFVIEIEEMEKHNLPNTGELRRLLAQVTGNKNNFDRSEKAMQELYSKINDATKNDLGLARDIVYEKGRRRKPATIQFQGKEYCLLMSHFGIMNFNELERKANGGIILPILISKVGFESLPAGEMFNARILGVVHFNPKPIYKNLGPSFVLIAAALSVGMIPKG